ncbi:DUF4174 domain-containing protein [Pararhodobacter sp. CCB-MM2]|uniref:DUF4174 domain-containing protein n=1 Tax=Pararhodobacter sp. CCB-MM2 TaxID=1786003 RepID=UPI00082BA062|nr:DUF4174 domain-containing protein [Pararhodobacter sp. CCB-MM2]
MKPVLLAFLLILAPGLAAAQTPAEDAVLDEGEVVAPEAPGGLLILDAADVDPEDFLWEFRIVAVMADSPNDPAFQRQMREISERPGDMVTRDVVVIVDSDRRSGSLLRQRLRPRGFMLAIIEKDGEIKQRRPAPRSVREIGDMIDRFPLRRQELLERLPAGR